MQIMDIQEHFKNILKCLQLERQEDLAQYSAKLNTTSFVAQRKNGIAWFPIDIERTKFDAGERLIVVINRKPEHKENHSFQSGKLVRVFAASSVNEMEFEAQGVINQVKDKSLTITLNVEDEPDWFRSKQLGVQLLFDDHSYREMEFTIKSILKLPPRELMDLTEEFLNEKEIETPSLTTEKHAFLNDSQIMAIQKALSSPKVSVIHGPPGTGKTTTLVELIEKICATENQLLVCAPSNTAVDLIVEKLVHKGFNPLRIGHPARVTQEALNQTMDAKFAHHTDYGLFKDLKKKSEEFFDMARKYKRNFGATEREQRRLMLHEAHQLKNDSIRVGEQIKESIIFSSRVIVCTLVGANHSQIKDLRFKTVLIDEAGQALEPACWIPIVKAKRVIFAGDHQQLPPTVKSREAFKMGLSTTLLDIVMRKKGVDSLLNVQYRMNSKIMQFSNIWFYNNQLQAHESNAEHLLDDSPITFIDTAGSGFEESLNPDTLSTENKEEAAFAVKYLQNLQYNLSMNGILPQEYTVGIISPYRAQVELLRELWTNEEDKIKISTIDGFQGQERDLIIISLVRSNPKSEIGFLSDYRRMNVALTRARKKLVVIGDSSTIGNDKFYNQFIQFTQDNNFYHSVFEFWEM